MYAPKLRDMTKEERWQEGQAWRIDQRAAEILAEIKAMTDRAREELGLIEKPKPKPPTIQSLYDLLAPMDMMAFQQLAAAMDPQLQFGYNQPPPAPGWYPGNIFGNLFGPQL